MDYFPQIFDISMRSEGLFTNNSADPGNWTGGRVGVGICKGTKYGISAAQYPYIENLTFSQAMAIYRADYWAKIQGDALPPQLAMLMFDSAINNGVSRSVRFLQTALGVAVDGVISAGGETINAVTRRAAVDITPVCDEVLAQRIYFMADDPDWKTFGLGWARRLAALPRHAALLAEHAG
jgi:lysozyme family protein